MLSAEIFAQLVPIKTADNTQFFFFFLIIFFQDSKAWHFMWIICIAEISSLIFTEKKTLQCHLLQCWMTSLGLSNGNTHIQSNLNSSNTHGLFTIANSNSGLSPYEILPMDQENKYLRKLSYFIMSTLNIQLLCRRSIDFQELAIFASRPGAMIYLQMARTNHRSNNFPWSQRCLSHWSSTIFYWISILETILMSNLFFRNKKHTKLLFFKSPKEQLHQQSWTDSNPSALQ